MSVGVIWALERALRVEVPGCCPPSRPKKTWRQCFEALMALERLMQHIEIVGSVSSIV